MGHELRELSKDKGGFPDSKMTYSRNRLIRAPRDMFATSPFGLSVLLQLGITIIRVNYPECKSNLCQLMRRKLWRTNCALFVLWLSEHTRSITLDTCIQISGSEKSP